MKKLSIFRYWLGTKIFRGKRQEHYLRKYKKAHLIVPDSFEKGTFSQPMEKTLLIVNTDSIGDYILFRNKDSKFQDIFMSNAIVKYDNDSNKIQLPSFTEQEQNLLFSIVSRIKETNGKNIRLF